MNLHQKIRLTLNTCCSSMCYGCQNKLQLHTDIYVIAVTEVMETIFYLQDGQQKNTFYNKHTNHTLYNITASS